MLLLPAVLLSTGGLAVAGLGGVPAVAGGRPAPGVATALTALPGAVPPSSSSSSSEGGATTGTRQSRPETPESARDRHAAHAEG
ncbi:MAG: hypothetical protein M3P93_07455, partial [Actinomycetota bacterium]|nr:hypothetical protein [Actinomycetota bacterium]